jgi:hypothetical protein
MKRQVTATEHRWDSHTAGSQERSHTEPLVASRMTAAGTNNALDRQVQRKPERVLWQQTSAIGARQGTIASGSCCSSRESSRSLAGRRTESFAATAHATADRHG